MRATFLTNARRARSDYAVTKYNSAQPEHIAAAEKVYKRAIWNSGRDHMVRDAKRRLWRSAETANCKMRRGLPAARQ